MARNNSCGIATAALWKITGRAWRTTFAPILSSFARHVVSVPCRTARGHFRLNTLLDQFVHVTPLDAVEDRFHDSVKAVGAEWVDEEKLRRSDSFSAVDWGQAIPMETWR